MSRRRQKARKMAATFQAPPHVLSRRRFRRACRGLGVAAREAGRALASAFAVVRIDVPPQRDDFTVAR